MLNTVIPPPPRVTIDDRPIRQSPPPPTGPSGQFRVSEKNNVTTNNTVT